MARGASPRDSLQASLPPPFATLARRWHAGCYELAVPPDHQPTQPDSENPRRRKEPREKLIRLNDLIPKRDVKGGSPTVFGAIRAKPGKPPGKKD